MYEIVSVVVLLLVVTTVLSTQTTRVERTWLRRTSVERCESEILIMMTEKKKKKKKKQKKKESYHQQHNSFSAPGQSVKFFDVVPVASAACSVK